MKLIVNLFIVFVLSFYISYSAAIKGTVADSSDGKPLKFAYVFLQTETDSAKYFAQTDKDGKFSILNISKGEYTLKISFVGYKTYKRKLTFAENENKELNKILLSNVGVEFGEVVVEAEMPAAQQKGDTTELNAGAFKVQSNAVAEDLIKKMPGMEIQTDGSVKAQGESVREVLVDGKKFFSDDPQVALKNLPAESIDKVQVFDKASEQSQLTGFDDGNSVKALNIVTKPWMRDGTFGKIAGGYGNSLMKTSDVLQTSDVSTGDPKHKFVGSAAYNMFNGTQRITLLGLANNINQQNFAIQDLMGVFGSQGQRTGGGPRFRQSGGPGFRPQMLQNFRPPQGSYFNSGDFLVSQSDGTSDVYSAGINYLDAWSSKLQFSGSYFFNLNDNNLSQVSSEQYFLSGDTSQFIDELLNENAVNINHRLNMQLDYNIDSSNTIIIKPSLTVQDNNRDSKFLNNTYISNQAVSPDGLQNPVSSTDNNNNYDNKAYNLNSRLVYRGKLDKIGRSLSLELYGSADVKDKINKLYAQSHYFSIDSLDTLNQKANVNSKTYNISSELEYTEPLDTNSMFQVSYNINYSTGNSEKYTYNFIQAFSDYNQLDSSLSNEFENNYLTNKISAGYRWRDSILMLGADIAYQRSDLQSLQNFPFSYDSKYNFNNFLPSAMLRYKISDKSNLFMRYRTYTSPPSLTQLQNVVDNSNPLQLSSGNPDLEQQYSHFIMARYFYSDYTNSTNFFIFAMANNTVDYIANSTFIATRDTVIENGTISLPAGTQFSKPVNLGGSLNVNSFMSYGFPWVLISSNINLNTNVSYSRTPSQINSQTNYSNTYRLGLGITIGSNISENLDFTLSTMGNGNLVSNSIQSSLNNNYYSQTSSLNFNWIFWEDLFFQTDFRHQLNVGYTSGYSPNYYLWNISTGIKLFDRVAELKLTIYDVLDNNKSIQRQVSDYYIKDTKSNVLRRYAMLSFQWNFRSFGG